MLQKVGTLKITSSSLYPIAADYNFCHSLRPNPTARHSEKKGPKLHCYICNLFQQLKLHRRDKARSLITEIP
jgi:hypothetical protein